MGSRFADRWQRGAKVELARFQIDGILHRTRLIGGKAGLHEPLTIDELLEHAIDESATVRRRYLATKKGYESGASAASV
jgi:hypothetical protein